MSNRCQSRSFQGVAGGLNTVIAVNPGHVVERAGEAPEAGNRQRGEHHGGLSDGDGAFHGARGGVIPDWVRLRRAAVESSPLEGLGAAGLELSP